MTMIETSTAYKVGDKIFRTFQEAQMDALGGLFVAVGSSASCDISKFVLDHKDEVLAILSMSEPVKRGRKPRSDQGKSHAKKKTKAPEAAPIESTVEGSEKYAGK